MFGEGLKDRYGIEILKDRVSPEILIISSLLNDLTLLDDYKLDSKDFLLEEFNIIFNMAKKMKQEGYTSISPLEIKGRLSSEEQESFKTKKIWKALANHECIANIENFPNYIDSLYKNNIYMKLTDLGVDLFKEAYFNGEKIIPFECFKKLTSEEVKKYYADIFNELSTVDTNAGIDECVIDFDEEYIQEIYEGRSIGTLFDVGGINEDGEEITAFPTISSNSNGFIDGSFSILSGYSNVGKSTFLISMAMALVHRGEKICICSNEQRVKPFKDNFLMWILVNKLGYREMDKNKLRMGVEYFTESDKWMINKARTIWEEEYKGKIMFISVPSARMEMVQKKFREYHLRKGCTFFIYDTFKMDFSGKVDKMYIGLIRDSRLLAEFANKYNVKVFATMQNALHTLGQLWLDANVLSNSKQVKEVLQNLYLIRNMYKEEKDPDSIFYCKPYTIKRGGKYMGAKTTVREAYDLDPNKDYKIIFLDKLRDGRTSEQGNYAVVVEFEGRFGTMKEVCLCEPKRKNINANQRNNTK